MLYNNFTEKLIDLQEVDVKNIENIDTNINNYLTIILLLTKRYKNGKAPVPDMVQGLSLK